MTCFGESKTIAKGNKKLVLFIFLEHFCPLTFTSVFSFLLRVRVDYCSRLRTLMVEGQKPEVLAPPEGHPLQRAKPRWREEKVRRGTPF